MTKAEAILCQKMFNIGNTIMFKVEGQKWVFINPDSEFDEDRILRLKYAGIGVLELESRKYFYLIDDYQYINGTFVAINNVVKSIPATNSSMIDVSGKVFDLSNYCGFINGSNIKGDEIIIGNDVAYFNIYGQEKYKEVCIKLLTEERNYDLLQFQTSKVKIVGDRPITSMASAFSRNHYIMELDMSEAKLDQCTNFAFLCHRAINLDTFKCGFISSDAECTSALDSTNLPMCYNMHSLKRNELGKMNAIQKREPAAFVKLDTPELKILITNLNEAVVENLYKGYKCKIYSYQGPEDAVPYPYAFAYREDVAMTANTIEYIHINYPEIAEDLTGVSKANALGYYASSSSNVF